MKADTTKRAKAKTKAALLTDNRLRDLLDLDPATRAFTWRVAHGLAAAGDVAGERIMIEGKTYGAARLAVFYLTGDMPVENAKAVEIEAALTAATERALDTKTLAAERLRCLMHYDQARGYFTWRVGRGGRAAAGTVAGKPDRAGYIETQIDRRYFRRARLAFLYMKGRWPMPQADHKDRLVDNDIWSNIREASPSNNSLNRERHNKHGVRGVSYRADRARPWSANITIGGKPKYLGLFTCKAEAAAAYEAAAAKHHGRFAANRRPGESEHYVSFPDLKHGVQLAEIALADDASAL
jgi:hypothetical protein